ncbi:glycoside hydrolase family 3 C-terminal domain-containing protein [Niveispirillum sp.]|uniref:beta-glucosidase n=1 Tax=Niveispirillum sp. TaxID=1917217 RepID=UPI001B55564E|nr:glycoside hydrolase family 3 C-terminal domain-containing protein [Niveispirillum sp.]MBP7334821.1 glycoside hydrolase family 3 C-terminal domain-containing protein [Niveispirillum sp.]
MSKNRVMMPSLVAGLCLASLSCSAVALAAGEGWRNPSLSPDERARLLDAELTLDERIGLLHGPMALSFPGGPPIPAGSVGGAGFIPGVPRLGIPALKETDASLGITNPGDVRPGDTATALPASLALAASFNPELAYEGGAMIAREAAAKGFNVLLAGGVNLARDPRNGRNFEYLGEDPWLAGTLAGESIKAIQDQNIISTIKHFSLNGQETGRFYANSIIKEAAHRESDLLAFQIAIEKGQPGSVMCAYNLVNGDYSCGNDHLLNGVLKGDWGYKGWVMSDWGAVHATDYAVKGLDQQSGEQLDQQMWFGEPLKQAALAGTVPEARLSDMSRRILRSMFAVGLFDGKPVKPQIDAAAHAAVAKKVADEGIVLLANKGILPLKGGAGKKIVVIGGQADAGVLSGAGSSQVTATGGNARVVPVGGDGPMAMWGRLVFHPSSPLKALRAALPDATITFADGRYPAEAAAAAKAADIAIVFANQWMAEALDAYDLSLPQGQDEMIQAVAAANPNSIVVLQTGGPVLMPWLDKVGAVVAAWYSGQKGGESIADVLTGRVNPSGRLPVTFPTSLDQYPRRDLPGWGLPKKQQFDVIYDEGADVGYRRFAALGMKPLFPFGHGLSYTSFAYDKLSVKGGETLTVSFRVTNTGAVAGKDAPQVYLTGAGGVKLQRLIGFDKVDLKPGETRTVTLKADPRLLASFDEAGRQWRITGGTYEVTVGPSASTAALTGTAKVSKRSLKP